ncbi:unnamed protein product, partial [Meganyctiphanes norvegica]
GAFSGMTISLLFMFWLGFGTNLATMRGEIVLPPKPTSIAGCSVNATYQLSHQIDNSNKSSTAASLNTSFTTEEQSDPLALYRLSYMWYSTTGCFIVIIIGMIVSFITGLQDVSELSPLLLSPG